MPLHRPAQAVLVFVFLSVAVQVLGGEAQMVVVRVVERIAVRVRELQEPVTAGVVACGRARGGIVGVDEARFLRLSARVRCVDHVVVDRAGALVGEGAHRADVGAGIDLGSGPGDVLSGAVGHGGPAVVFDGFDERDVPGAAEGSGGLGAVQLGHAGPDFGDASADVVFVAGERAVGPDLALELSRGPVLAAGDSPAAVGGRERGIGVLELPGNENLLSSSRPD